MKTVKRTDSRIKPLLQTKILGTRLGFYRIVDRAYVSAVLVVNLDNPGAIGTNRVVHVTVEEYGQEHVVEVSKGYRKAEKLKRRDKDEAQAECLADLIRIGMGASTRRIRYRSLVEECKRNAVEAAKCFKP